MRDYGFVFESPHQCMIPLGSHARKDTLSRSTRPFGKIHWRRISFSIQQNKQEHSMLVLILDPAMTVAYVAADAALEFAPSQDFITKPVADCAVLLAADPALLNDCRMVLATKKPKGLGLRSANGSKFLRKIALRETAHQPTELIITYEYAPDLPNAAAHNIAVYDNDLAQELRRRDAAITATGAGLCITDDKGVIIDVNPALTSMLGQDRPSDLIGASWWSLFADASVSALRDFGLDALHDAGTWHGPALMRCKKGRDLEVDLSLTEMQDNAVIWVCRDVTARNETQRQLLAAQANIQRAQRQEIVNLIAAGFTHDLTNLVALISHLSDPALRDHFAQNKDVLAEIHCAARQMVALLEPIKQLGRRQSPRMRLDLGALLAEAAGILRISAPRGLQIITKIADEPLHVDGDRMQLMQVLLNLGLNAREALDEGAQTITLSLKRATALPKSVKLETGVIPPAPFALFAITDTGPGMNAATRAKIWEPYFTTKTLSGSGLGLFVVANIVRGAGGGIALTTAPGKSTTFYIAWPLDQGA
jgi:PAS domain S-box-containing protein